MDYPFFIGKVAQCRPEMLAQLRELADAGGYKTHHNFAHKPDKVVLENATLTTDWNEVPQKLQQLFGSLGFTPEQFAVASFNRLAENSRIGEHSDFTGSGELGVVKALRHIIHISLYGEDVEYGHRRSNTEAQSLGRMEPGGVYVYNNYVWHYVLNKSAVPRVNMLFEFDDPRMTLRGPLLALFDQDIPSKRYQSRDVYPISNFLQEV
jgi:hypothetical protein